MRFLLKEEWEASPSVRERIPDVKINELLEDIYCHIATIVHNKGFNREIFGIAMTLFHYYTYFKSLNEVDRIELSVGCVYLACKSQYLFIPMEEVVNIFLKIKNNRNERIPDFIKFEVEILSFLGFEVDIETPYSHFYSILEKNNPSLLKNERMKNFAFNIINDAYRRPLCIFYHPKIIVLAVLYISARYHDIDLSFEELLGYERDVKQEDLVECLEAIIGIIEMKVKL